MVRETWYTILKIKRLGGNCEDCQSLSAKSSPKKMAVRTKNITCGFMCDVHNFK